MVVAGRQNESGGVDILMVEAEATSNAIALMEDGAPKPTEEAIGLALEIAKSHIATACELQRELLAQTDAQPKEYSLFSEYGEDVAEAVRRVAEEASRDAITIADKAEREARLDEIKADTLQKVTEQLGEALVGREREVSAAFRSLTKELVRQRIVKEAKRIDGRGPRDIRPLSAEVGILPRAHGSGLFQRGETQVLNITTLGMVRMEQMIDTLDPEDRKRYMHHYNFPPFSTGETGFMRGPKRREIGHGALAERALLPVIPSREEFPYALRLVSEVLSSNGSTSMASVCASTLSLMDAGVPIKAPVGGIAMGLIAEGGQYVTLTAIQLDMKVTGLPQEVLAGALKQAKEARLAILDHMAETIAQPREALSMKAPRVIMIQIPVDKIGEVIGPKGKRINEIIAVTGADINIEDDGRVFIGSREGEGAQQAVEMVEEIANPRPIEVGDRFDGMVVKTTTFGAFVNILPGRDGLVHISKLGRGKRLSSVEEAVNVGDKLTVEVQEVDPQGKISLKPVGEGWDPPEGGWPRVEGEDRGERPFRERREGGRPRDRDRDRGFRPRRDRGDRERRDP